MKKSKYQRELEAKVAQISAQERSLLVTVPNIKQIFDAISPSKKQSISLRTATATDNERILGLDVSAVRKRSATWQLPEDVQRFQTSKWCKKSLGIIEDNWSLTSENATRTIIDIILLDVLNQANTAKPENSEKMSSWTEVSLSYTNPITNEEMSGRGDYFIGYCQSPVVKDALHTLLLAGEAKALDAERNIWQIIGYCGMLHLVRAEYLKANPGSQNKTIYGFLTDSAVWEFVRVDNDGKVWTSARITDFNDVETWLYYMVKSARTSTPSATPNVSLEDLSQFAYRIEKFSVTNLTEDSDEEDDEEEAEALRQRLAVGRD